VVLFHETAQEMNDQADPLAVAVGRGTAGPLVWVRGWQRERRSSQFELPAS